LGQVMGQVSFFSI